MSNSSSRGPLSIRAALISSTVYIIGMAGAMTLVPLGGRQYGEPGMVYDLWWPLLLLSVLAALLVHFRSSWRAAGVTSPVAPSSVGWWLPLAIALGVMSLPLVAALSAGIDDAQIRLLAVVLVTTLFVGFAEELVFRGVLLHAFLARMSAPLAVLLSSVGFSLLHSINVLAGMPVPDMLTQLVNTFVAGVFYASLVVLTGNIVFGMVVHFLWDFILLGTSGVVTVAPDASFGIAMLALDRVAPIVLFAVVVIRHVRRRRRATVPSTLA